MIGSIAQRTIASYKLSFNTQYNQFYIRDKSSPGRTDSEMFWTDEAYKERLAIEEGIVGVGTECYGHVRAEIILLDKKLAYDANKTYDHVVEGGLEIKSDVLQILDCPNSNVEKEFKIRPGRYRVRVYSSNLASVDDDEEKGQDYYKIEIWPDGDIKRKVLKQWNQ